VLNDYQITLGSDKITLTKKESSEEAEPSYTVDQEPEQKRTPSSPGFKQIKRKALEDRKELLIKQYEAANQQLNSTVNAANKIIIQEQIKNLEKEIEEVEAEISKV